MGCSVNCSDAVLNLGAIVESFDNTANIQVWINQ
jgi:hypothetical protein